MSTDRRAVELVFPLEFVVEGVPKSAQRSGSKGNEHWKALVREAAIAAMGQEMAPTAEEVVVSFYVFSRGPLPGDLDNKIKFTMDALNGVVFVDDSQIIRHDTRSFTPGSFASPPAISDLLIETAAGEEKCVYLRITTDLNEEL